MGQLPTRDVGTCFAGGSFFSLFVNKIHPCTWLFPIQDVRHPVLQEGNMRNSAKINVDLSSLEIDLGHRGYKTSSPNSERSEESAFIYGRDEVEHREGFFQHFEGLN